MTPTIPPPLAELQTGWREIRLHPHRRVVDRDRIRRPDWANRSWLHHLSPEQLQPDSCADSRHHDPALDRRPSRNFRAAKRRPVLTAVISRNGPMQRDAGPDPDHAVADRLYGERPICERPRQRREWRDADTNAIQLHRSTTRAARTHYYDHPPRRTPEKNYAGRYRLRPAQPVARSTPVERRRSRTTSMRCSLRPGAAPRTRPRAGSAPPPTLPYTVTLPFGGTALLSDLQSGTQILADAEQDPIEMTQNGDGIVDREPRCYAGDPIRPEGVRGRVEFADQLRARRTGRSRTLPRVSP